MPTFAPIGDQARWRTVYEHLKAANIGDVVTYEQLGEALGLNPEKERHPIQMAVRRAAKEYQDVDKRALDSVPNQGYRIVEASEHLVLARRQQARSSRALERGHRVATNVDLNQVDDHTRRALEAVATAFSYQMEFNRRFDVRQRRLEQAVAAQSERVERTETEIAELKARLSELENRA
ncbi:hypothetical protein [Planomonospora venezuelensis]|uniref:Uncharacterized protein n=1 Tax=Planomonospora venezuelensis TaxID=1999 RepID=A0A841D8Z7_PLAVE|nr:hypothetical protein [Planomonospora venezuelensis]MBB5965067.1 hypothetical protein [Planomonospora venezuelensis]GIN05016.1 hypothetical protein Pve01_66740 [Planomonospora venezuelensis]